MSTQIELSKKGDIQYLRMVPSPGKPPVLEPNSLAALDQAIADIEAASPRLVVLESDSERFFCLGADIKVLQTTTIDSIGPWVLEGNRVLNRLEALPCPVIARVGGYAMGGGLEIAMACDFIFAETSAVFGQSEAKLGFIPGWGGTFRLAERIGATRAKRYFYTGDTIDATTAESIGLADYLGDSNAVTGEIERVAKAVAGNSAYALATFKKITNAQRRHALDHNAQTEAESSSGCVADPDTQARIEAFFNRKK